MLWISILGFPIFISPMIAFTFDGTPTPGSPAWTIWSLRVLLVLAGYAIAAPCLKELRRRGAWVPPGVQTYPWLAAFGYVVTIMLTASTFVVGLNFCLKAIIGE
jgi:hypothetical protein